MLAGVVDMTRTILRLAGVGLAAIVGLAACQTTGQQTTETEGTVLSADATAFTRGELYSYLSGKTQVWDEGGAYYASNGTLQTLWEGERAEGEWETTKDGELCWYVKSWGETPCEKYYNNGDVISIVYKGETSLAPERIDGNALDSLAAGAPPEEATAFEPELFTKTETTALVSGKSVIWEGNGGAYYAPDFTLITKWDGVRERGTWSVTEDGGVCWHITSWGKTPCEYYFLKDGKLMALYEGEQLEASEHVQGDMTNSM